MSSLKKAGHFLCATRYKYLMALQECNHQQEQDCEALQILIAVESAGLTCFCFCHKLINKKDLRQVQSNTQAQMFMQPQAMPLASSRVHTIETTVHQSQPDYRSLLLKGLEDEYQATVDAFNYYYGMSAERHISQLERCSTFAFFCMDQSDRTIKVSASRCRLRWCPICAKKHAYIVKRNTELWYKEAAEPKLLTLTIQHGDSTLAEQIGRIQKSFRLFRRATFTKNWIRGGIWFLQTKRSSNSETWHTHLHIVLDAPYMRKERISEIWSKCSNGSFIIDIKSVRNAEHVADYVGRYVSRPLELAELDDAQKYEAISALHGRRMCGTFGSAKGVSLCDKPNDDAKPLQKLCGYGVVYARAQAKQIYALLIQYWLSKLPLPEYLEKAIIDDNQISTESEYDDSA